MKWMTLILLVMCLTAFADDTSHKKSRPKPPPNAKTVKTLTLPPGAKPAGANTWNYTDPQGKKWIYRKTPFGLSRIDAEAEAAAAGEAYRAAAEAVSQARKAAALRLDAAVADELAPLKLDAARFRTVVAPLPQGLSTGTAYFLVYPPERMSSAPIRAFRNWLLKTVGDAKPD